MIVAHVSGIPMEETVLQLAPAAAAMLTAVWVSARHALRRRRAPAVWRRASALRRGR